MRLDPRFWNGKSVLLTGHTGFKGAWASRWLRHLGARVTGVALAPATDPNLFDLADVGSAVTSVIADIRDADGLRRIAIDAEPDIVIHMAAQALVRPSYADPLATLDTNIIGTAHLLDALRAMQSVNTVLVITSDKVYLNDETDHGFTEKDPLGGHDLYSASKAAAEIVTASYRDAFFADRPVAIATARGGNVIGGGDFSADRIVPDIWRAARADEPLILRYPEATRPWQHVLDCLNGYLLFIERLAQDPTGALPRSLNFGPTAATSVAVATLAETMQDYLKSAQGWQRESGYTPREMNALRLDTTLARDTLGWRDYLPAPRSLEWTAAWYLALDNGADMQDITDRQIQDFMDLQ